MASSILRLHGLPISSDSAASSPVTLVQKNPSDDRSRLGGIYCISGTIKIVFKHFFKAS